MPVEVFRDEREAQRSAVLAHAGFDQAADLRIARFSENVDHCKVHPGADYHSACLILSGGMIRIDKPAPKIRPGTITVEPVEFGGTFTNDEQTDWLSVYISKARLVEMARTVFPDARDLRLLRAEGEADPQLADLIRCCAGTLLHRPDATQLELDGWAQVIAMHLLNAHSTMKAQPAARAGDLSPKVLQIILEMIEDELEADLSLASMARHLDIGTTRLSLGFRAATGKSLHQYVIERRVQRAREALERTTLPLSEIAFAVGFSSQSHMTASFRARLGITPGRYRKLKGKTEPKR